MNTKEFNPKIISFEDLLSKKRKLIVPPFQRHYEWDKKDWKRFLQDIKDMTSSEDSEEMHFIGNIILNKSPNQDNTKLYTKYRIIDGQQRVTTFCIFLLAIKSLLNLDFPADKREKDQIEEILKIFEENNGQLIEKTLRIELQESDELVFKEIVSAKDPNTRLIVMKWFIRDGNILLKN